MCAQYVTMGAMHGDEAVRTWRAEVGGGAICMHGTTSTYAVDPAGEYVVGMVLAGGMEVRRDARGPSLRARATSAHGTPRRATRGARGARHGWEARLIVLELPAVQDLVRDPEVAGGDVAFASPRVRDPRLARRFLELHAALEAPAWRLERDTLLQEWLCALAGEAPVAASRAARRDPALRRACELLGEDLARNLTLAEVAAAAGVSRHRLTRLFRAAFGLPPHRFVLAQRVRAARRLLERGVTPGEVAQQTGFFDQSHLHRHFTRTLGMTPGAYAAALRSDVQDARGVST